MLFGQADTQAIMKLVPELDADVLSTQELTPEAVERLDAAGLRELMPHRVVQAEWSAGGSGLFSRHPLDPIAGCGGALRATTCPRRRLTLPGARPIEFIDVHPVPAARPSGDRVERRPWTPSPAASAETVRILAGDFNASLDHAAMRRLLIAGYKDAADQVGPGLIPTWPANKRIPPIITIDHVLVDQRVGVKAVSVHDVPGTDHRAVFAELTVP